MDLLNQYNGDRSLREIWDHEIQPLLCLPVTDSDGKHTRVDLMLQIWLSTHPKHIRSQLDSAKNKDMDALFDQAEAFIVVDRIYPPPA